MNDGDVVLLQNVRFNPEETSKDPEERAAYAKKIAALGEVFVSDGFGVVHRAQGSNYDVAADLPAAAGLLVEKEVKALSRATVNPERPLTVVLGGSKVSDKLGVIDNLLDKANRLVIGGGMAYTFLKAKGYEVVGKDFMKDVSEGKSYDRIVMNPPFSKRQDTEHVRRAYDLLKPGGRLVAIVSEGSFFGKDKKASEFRDWLEEVGGTSEKLAEGFIQRSRLACDHGRQYAHGHHREGRYGETSCLTEGGRCPVI